MMNDNAQRGSGPSKRPALNLAPPARRAPSLEQNLKATQDEDLARLTTDVPKDVKKRLKLKAAEDGTTVRQLVLRGISMVLDED